MQTLPAFDGLSQGNINPTYCRNIKKTMVNSPQILVEMPRKKCEVRMGNGGPQQLFYTLEEIMVMNW